MDCFCAPPRTLACRVVLLDERELMHDLQDTSTGQSLLDAVFRHLDLLETSYFGIRYVDQDNQTHWLEAGKRLKRQLRGADRHTFYFGVKFYAADPCKLLEEITRYQVFLQVKQDVLRGRLPVNFELAAELAAYALQSELGDYDARRHGHGPAAAASGHMADLRLAPPQTPGYVSEFRLAPHQTPELEARAAELHQTLAGMSPAAAELSYLEKVKWLDMYGVDLHPVLGEDSAEHYLGLAPSGVLLLRGRRVVAQYYWPRVARLDRKGRYFMLRVRQADKHNEASTYGFETSSRAACSHLWRCCSEQHAFFRAQQVAPATDIFVRTERFRHSSSSAQQGTRPPPVFTRAASRRVPRARIAPDIDTDTRNSNDPLKADDVGVKEMPEVSQPTSVTCPVSLESPYRATCGPAAYSANGTGAGGGSSPRSGRSGRSARSSRSVPHGRRGLYRGSPPSARSAPGPLRAARHRSTSADSQSSGESRNGRKHRHRSRRGRASDAESEASRSSARHRERRHRTSSDTDCRTRTAPRHREYSLVESETQWREVQRLRAGVGVGVGAIAGVGAVSTAAGVGGVAAVASVRRAEHKHRKHRKHRSRSGSPDKSWLPSELKEHLEFKLIDTSGMSEAQLKEIPYTVVQTSQARQTKLRHSNRERHKQRYVNMAELPLRPGLPGADPVSGQRGSAMGPVSTAMAVVTVHNNTHNQHSNSSSGELATVSRVSHDHTDSGLGADQDYAYSSERSSDSTKHPVGIRTSSASNRNQASNESYVQSPLAPAPTGPLSKSNDADASDACGEIEKQHTDKGLPTHGEMSTEL